VPTAQLREIDDQMTCNLRKAAPAIILLLLAGAAEAPAAQPRLWSSRDGQYTLEAQLVAFNERSVILQRADHELVTIPIDQLSDEDRKHLESEEAGKATKEWAAGFQTWVLRNGTTISGRVVDYASKDVTIQRRRRRTYVNDRVLSNLPKFYQEIVPAIVAHFEKLPRADLRGLQAWVRRQGDEAKTFHVDGVILETENGDEYGVPFFLFSDSDQSLLQAGWDEWRAAKRGPHAGSSEDHSFMLESLAAALLRDKQVKREIALMQLKLQAVEAGVTSLWEVTLYPAAGQGGPPLWVVVPGRDSRQATAAALQQNPGYVAGPVRSVSRRR
jgi:hypothetical protein